MEEIKEKDLADHVLAAMWEKRYKSRNDSIIMDYFKG